MRFRSTFLAFIAAAIPVSALAAPPSAASAKPAATELSFRRVELKPNQGGGMPLPYTIEVPQDWQVRQVEGYSGLWLGPADAKPPQDPRLIWVRGSTVSLAKPEEVVANIKANDAAKPEWTAPRVEVKEVGGVRGVLVRMDTGEGDKARSSLTLKLPLESLALDFVASADRADFEKQLPLYERILLSVRPAAAKAK